MKAYSGAEHVNVGTGEDVTILELTQVICEVVGFNGAIVMHPSKPMERDANCSTPRN